VYKSKKIRLPKSLIEIKSKLFLDCKKLIEVKIPDSVISIGEFAFGRCERLQNVQLPNSLHIIQQQRAFEGCKEIKFSIKNNPHFSASHGMLFNANKSILIAYPSASGEVVIPTALFFVDLLNCASHYIIMKIVVTTTAIFPIMQETL